MQLSPLVGIKDKLLKHYMITKQVNMVTNLKIQQQVLKHVLKIEKPGNVLERVSAHLGYGIDEIHSYTFLFRK